MFLPQGLFSLALAVAGSPVSRGMAINAGTMAVPGWLSPSCVYWAVLLDPGRVPHRSHALVLGGGLTPCPESEFPMYSVVVKDILRKKVTVPSSGAAVPQGPSRAGGPDVAQKPKLGTLLVKEG